MQQDRLLLTRAAVVGNIIFLSGLTGINMGTDGISPGFKEQMQVCLDNVRTAIEAAGGSLDNLVKNFIPILTINIGYYTET